MELNPMMCEVVDLGTQIKFVLDRFKSLGLRVKMFSTDGTNQITVDYSFAQLSTYLDYDSRAQFIVDSFVELDRPRDSNNVITYTGDEYGMLVICTRPRYINNDRVADSHLCELLLYVNNNQNGRMNLDGFIALLCQCLSADKIGNLNYGEYWMEQGLLPRKYEVTSIQDGGILHVNLTSKLLRQSVLVGLDAIR